MVLSDPKIRRFGVNFTLYTKGLPKLKALPEYPDVEMLKKNNYRLKPIKWSAPPCEGRQNFLSVYFEGRMKGKIDADSFHRIMASVEPIHKEDVRGGLAIDRRIEKQFRDQLPYYEGLRKVGPDTIKKQKEFNKKFKKGSDDDEDDDDNDNDDGAASAETNDGFEKKKKKEDKFDTPTPPLPPTSTTDSSGAGLNGKSAAMVAAMALLKKKDKRVKPRPECLNEFKYSSFIKLGEVKETDSGMDGVDPLELLENPNVERWPDQISAKIQWKDNIVQCKFIDSDGCTELDWDKDFDDGYRVKVCLLSRSFSYNAQNAGLMKQWTIIQRLDMEKRAKGAYKSTDVVFPGLRKKVYIKKIRGSGTTSINSGQYTAPTLGAIEQQLTKATAQSTQSAPLPTHVLANNGGEGAAATQVVQVIPGGEGWAANFRAFKNNGGKVDNGVGTSVGEPGVGGTAGVSASESMSCGNSGSASAASVASVASVSNSVSYASSGSCSSASSADVVMTETKTIVIS
jgi:hypothetical protein